MELTVNQLLMSEGLMITGRVKWGERFTAGFNGVYIISLSDNPQSNSNCLRQPVFRIELIESWINIAKCMKIDQTQTPTVERITSRLNEFWHPNENILYIGKADKQNIDTRIKQFYQHQIGYRSPHKGGFWLKLLECLPSLFIYYSEIKVVTSIDSIENNLLFNFLRQAASPSNRRQSALPFANREYKRDGHTYRKGHNISKPYYKKKC